jgi:hypothetical protein
MTVCDSLPAVYYLVMIIVTVLNELIRLVKRIIKSREDDEIILHL